MSFGREFGLRYFSVKNDESGELQSLFANLLTCAIYVSGTGKRLDIITEI
jgi:hypothetical protein